MTLQAYVSSNQHPLKPVFDLPNAPTLAQVVPSMNKQQEEQAEERRYLVNHIDDLCDCV